MGSLPGSTKVGTREQANLGELGPVAWVAKRELGVGEMMTCTSI